MVTTHEEYWSLSREERKQLAQEGYSARMMLTSEEVKRGRTVEQKRQEIIERDKRRDEMMREAREDVANLIWERKRQWNEIVKRREQDLLLRRLERERKKRQVDTNWRELKAIRNRRQAMMIP